MTYEKIRKTVEYFLEGAQTDAEVRERLDDVEFVYMDESRDYGTLVLSIPAKDAYVLVYRNAEGNIVIGKREIYDIS